MTFRAAMVLWIRVGLPSNHTGFESRAPNLQFYSRILSLHWDEDENKQKVSGFGPYFKNKWSYLLLREFYLIRATR